MEFVDDQETRLAEKRRPRGLAQKECQAFRSRDQDVRWFPALGRAFLLCRVAGA
jgi:hypothetical protein